MISGKLLARTLPADEAPPAPEGAPYVPCEIDPWVTSRGKRLLDVVLGSMGLIVLAFVGAPIALAIRLDSRGPVLHSQLRCGRHGEPFRIFKFRSMVADSASEPLTWTSVDDPRITRVGRFLRALHLDELPQFVNVVRGDMSMVGPRPEQVAIAERLRMEIARYQERERVRPGLISTALLAQGYVDSVDGSRVKLAHDLNYLQNAGLGTDLTIVARALAHSSRREGR